MVIFTKKSECLDYHQSLASCMLQFIFSVYAYIVRSSEYNKLFSSKAFLVCESTMTNIVRE